jgi:hypothetical protein
MCGKDYSNSFFTGRMLFNGLSAASFSVEEGDN